MIFLSKLITLISKYNNNFINLKTQNYLKVLSNYCCTYNLVLLIYIQIIFKYAFLLFCTYILSVKLLGIYCDCGDSDGTEDTE